MPHQHEPYARLAFAAALVGCGLTAQTAAAADLPATPDDYQSVLGQLAPGDVMVLAPGEYPRLSIDGLHGTEDDWITIRGPEDGSAVITSNACCNTVQIENSSYLAVVGLTIDIGGLAVDGVNAKDSYTHHIRIEDNWIEGFPEGAQQIVGINTKATAYAWEIRGNTIVAPGTGMYLGNSDGNAPFIGGVVDRNLITDSVGYCMQIKHQNAYQAPAGVEGPQTTVISRNVFIKDDTPSPDGARPNLLVGGFPDQGDGADDRYEIYGNFLFYNPAESLFQGTGRISMHDNVLVGTGAGGTAIALQSHQGHDMRLANVYNNTIYGVDTGVSLGGTAAQGSAVVGNLIFAANPISGAFDVDADNLVASVGEADTYVVEPSTTLGAMDFFPLDGEVVGPPLDLAGFSEDSAYDRDFNGASKGRFAHRGAYAGSGANPGCPLEASIDCDPPDDGGDDGSDDGDDGMDDGPDDGADSEEGGADSTGGDGADTGGPGGSTADGGDEGSGSGVPADGGSSDPDTEAGCSCRAPGSGQTPPWWLAIALLALPRRRR
ncbi:MAG: MYXO-CTERM sorting domain-containing protein [Myxococcota bacterium]